jgi:short-subunit dehydrogenase
VIGTKLALRGMLDRRTGHIVNVGSYLGKVPAAGLATVSKHAVVGFSEALRDELAGTGVTVTAVLPSAVRTELAAGVKLGGLLPTVDPEDIAAALFQPAPTGAQSWLSPAWMRAYELAAAAIPDRLLGAIRWPTHPRPCPTHPRHHSALRLRRTGARHHPGNLIR